MKIGYVSDLHLEFNDYPDFSKESGGDVLLLAGDITTAGITYPPRNDAQARSIKKYMAGPFKKDLLDKFNQVYMVMGNHEHYNWAFFKTKETLEYNFQQLNLSIKVLDNDFVNIDDITLIGATLWSDFEKGNPVSMNTCEWGMNDFRLIAAGDGDYFTKFKAKPITADMLMIEHNKSLQYIKEILNRQGVKPTIVMSHHGPTYKSLNKEHIGNGMDGAYCSDLSDFIMQYPQIKYWIHGHTHANMNYMVGPNTTVLANQRGYNWEPSYRNFNGIQYIEV